jgi:hypothetical protein
LIVFEEKDEDCLTNDSEEFRRPRKNRKENRCLKKNFVAAGEIETGQKGAAKSWKPARRYGQRQSERLRGREPGRSN